MELLTDFFTPECFVKYFVARQFSDGHCFKVVLSKFLGLLVMLVAIPSKIPQILKIYQNETGEGINTTSITLEIVADAIYAAYNYAKGFSFLQWGDVFFLLVQSIIIAYLVLYYNGEQELAIGYVLVCIVSLFVLMVKVPVDVLWGLQGVNIIIFIASKFLQAYENYVNGHTGQLSAITFWILFLGSLARIFTSIQETGDSMVILANLVACIANGVIVAQIHYYWSDIKEKRIESDLDEESETSSVPPSPDPHISTPSLFEMKQL